MFRQLARCRARHRRDQRMRHGRNRASAATVGRHGHAREQAWV